MVVAANVLTLFCSYAWIFGYSQYVAQSKSCILYLIKGTIYIYQISDTNNLVWHVITQAADYSKDWKLLENCQE